MKRNLQKSELEEFVQLPFPRKLSALISAARGVLQYCHQSSHWYVDEAAISSPRILNEETYQIYTNCLQCKFNHLELHASPPLQRTAHRTPLKAVFLEQCQNRSTCIATVLLPFLCCPCVSVHSQYTHPLETFPGMQLIRTGSLVMHKTQHWLCGAGKELTST